MSKRITKTEKQGILFILVGIIVFAFLTDPITNIVSDIFPGNVVKFIIGLLLIFFIAYVGKLNKVFK